MKKCLTAGIFAAAVLIMLPHTASAREIIGGPLWGTYGAQWVDSEEVGDSSAGVAFGRSRDITYYGASFSHVITDDLRASVDLGMVNLNTPLLDDGIAVQGGLSHKLNLDLADKISTEVQAKGFYAFIDDVDVFGGSVSTYGTYDLGLTAEYDVKVYVGAGVHYQDINYSPTFLRDEHEFHLGTTLGFRVDFSDALALDANVTVVNEPIYLVGASIGF
jgi:hypothetical protein